MTNSLPRVLIVAEHASARFGGEAFLPLHYFRVLRARGCDVQLLCHARVRQELTELFPHDLARLHFVPDRAVQVGLHRLGQRMPARVAARTLGIGGHLLTQVSQRALARRLVRQHAIDVVHEPIPVSPSQPSLMFGVGAPVVIGPMNGGIGFPPAFRFMEGPWHVPDWAVRVLSGAANRLLPGKRRAAVLLVANQRTRAALPKAVADVPTLTLAENGVDLERWRSRRTEAEDGRSVRFAFVGRLIELKAVDILLEALAPVARATAARLEIFGEGPERSALEAKTEQLALQNQVNFQGFVSQSELAVQLPQCDALILPSLCECGGAVVLEAMALGLPVIASNWGGPADYVDESCGILAFPDTRESFREQLTSAMLDLASSPERRRQLGCAARKKVEEQFDWEQKVDRMLEIYRFAMDEGCR